MNDEFNWHEDSSDDEIEEVSKTQIKREMDELQALGKKLLALSEKQLAKIPLNDALHAAIDESKRIKKNEAVRRHLQYIGKLMRDADAEAIREAIDLQDPSSDAHARLHMQLEKWRDRLMADGKTAMTEFMGEFPEVDRQRLRQLVSNGAKELAKQPDVHTARKKLYQFLRETEEGQRLQGEP